MPLYVKWALNEMQSGTNVCLGDKCTAVLFVCLLFLSLSFVLSLPERQHGGEQRGAVSGAEQRPA